MASRSTFDAAGNFLFADEENQVVRRLAAIGGEIRPSSTVSTVAGTGFEMPMFGGGRYSRAQDGLRPTEVDLNAPTGLALRQGRLFVAEMENGVLRVVDAGGDGRIDGDASERLSYVAGGEGIKRPGSVAVDAAGNAYVGEFFHARIRKADPSGQITTLVGTEVPSFSIEGVSPAPGDNGPVRDATIGVASAVRIDRDGNMWFLDSYPDRGTTSLRRIRATRNKSKAPVLGPTSRIDKIAELDFAGSAMAVGADSVYVTDPEHNRIWEVRIRDGQVLPFAGTGERTPSVDDCSGSTAEDRGDGGPAQSATMAWPLGVALDASEARVFIGDTGNHVLRVVDLATGVIDTLADFNSEICTSLFDVVVDGDRFLYTVSGSFWGEGSQIQRIDLESVSPVPIVVAGNHLFYGGGFTGDGPATEVDLDGPAINIGPDGVVYIAEWQTQRIRRLVLPAQP